MTRWNRFWVRVNTFTASLIDPIPYPAPGRLPAPTETDGPWAPGPPAGGREGPPRPGFHPFRTTLISVGADRVLSPGFLPERPWWDQTGLIDAPDLEPPHRLDLSDLDHITGRN